MPTGIVPHRYTENEREDAYMRWAYEFNKNMTHTAESLDIPIRTLQYWKAHHQWDERYNAETAEIAGIAFEYGVNELRIGISRAALQLIDDCSNTKATQAERLASQKLLFSLMLGSQDNPPTAATHISLTEARHIHLPPTANNQSIDASHVAARAIESNLASANALQSRRRSGH